MAWTSGPTLNVTLFFRDDDGAEGEHRISVPLSALSLVNAWLLDYMPLVAAVSTCALYKARITLVARDDGSQIAAVGSNVRRHTVLLFETAEGQPFALSIPGLVSARLLTAGPYAGVHVDTRDPAIVALVDLVINGAGAARPVAPWNSTDGGVSEWEWAGMPFARFLSAYWGYERPSWR